MEYSTKEKILDAALVSFVDNGYKGTNLRDLAAGLGLSKSALYRHYESKEAIWNALLDKMEAYYAERFGSIENMPEMPDSCDAFFFTVMKMVNFTVRDEKIILTRKLLLSEQFRDERVKELATEHFVNGTRGMFKVIFERMMEKDLLKRDDPDVLAFSFTAPITALIHYCDREPDKQAEVMRQIEAFVKRFINMYSI